MRFKEIIDEAVTDDYLYHATYVENADKIIRSNKIEARTFHTENKHLRFNLIGIKPADIKPPGTMSFIPNRESIQGVSLTRSLPLARSWIPYGIVLVFDRKMLMTKFRLVTLTYYEHRNRATFGESLSEAEEFLLGDLTNIERYLRAIYISQKTANAVKNKIEPFEDAESTTNIMNHPLLTIHGGEWTHMGIAKKLQNS